MGNRGWEIGGRGWEMGERCSVGTRRALSACGAGERGWGSGIERSSIRISRAFERERAQLCIKPLPCACGARAMRA